MIETPTQAVPQDLYLPVHIDSDYKSHPYEDKNNRAAIARRALIDYVLDVVLNPRKTKDRDAVEAREIATKHHTRSDMVMEAHFFPLSTSKHELWEWYGKSEDGYFEGYFLGRIGGHATQIVFETDGKAVASIEVC